MNFMRSLPPLNQSMRRSYPLLSERPSGRTVIREVIPSSSEEIDSRASALSAGMNKPLPPPRGNVESSHSIIPGGILIVRWGALQIVGNK